MTQCEQAYNERRDDQKKQVTRDKVVENTVTDERRKLEKDVLKYLTGRFVAHSMSELSAQRKSSMSWNRKFTAELRNSAVCHNSISLRHSVLITNSMRSRCCIRTIHLVISKACAEQNDKTIRNS